MNQPETTNDPAGVAAFEWSHVHLARKIAEEVHKYQCRSDGTPYIEHPRRVAALVESSTKLAAGEFAVAAAWLHDVLEDSELTVDDLLEHGVAPYVVGLCEVLTRRPDELYSAYIMRVIDDKMAVQIKIADILDNLADVPSRRQVKKYAGALRLLVLGEDKAAEYKR